MSTISWETDIQTGIPPELLIKRSAFDYRFYDGLAGLEYSDMVSFPWKTTYLLIVTGIDPVDAQFSIDGSDALDERSFQSNGGGVMVGISALGYRVRQGSPGFPRYYQIIAMR